MGEVIDLRDKFAHIRAADRRRRLSEMTEAQLRIENIRSAMNRINDVMKDETKCMSANTSNVKSTCADVANVSDELGNRS